MCNLVGVKGWRGRLILWRLRDGVLWKMEAIQVAGELF